MGLLAAVPTILGVVGGVVKAGAEISGANAQAKDLNSQATQLDARAGAVRASSQRSAIDQRRQARLTNSRALAVAAASGGSATDPTVVNIIANTEGEGEYRALTDLYNGNEQGISYEQQAAARRTEAKNIKKAGKLKAFSTVLSTGESLFSRYNSKSITSSSSSSAKPVSNYDDGGV